MVEVQKVHPVEERLRSTCHLSRSCDAVLMAWPLMDVDNKRPSDPFCTNCCIEGIPINQLSFVDDLAQFTKNTDETKKRNIGNEVFEKINHLHYKVPKCKLAERLKENVDICLNDEIMEVVDNHTYLGTLVSRNGERVVDMKERMKKSNSVANEIVQICKETELSRIRLRYVKVLTCSCLDSKVKFGSSLCSYLACYFSRYCEFI